MVHKPYWNCRVTEFFMPASMFQHYILEYKICIIYTSITFRFFMSCITAVIHIEISKDTSENNVGYSIYHVKAYFPSFHMHMPQMTEWLNT